MIQQYKFNEDKILQTIKEHIDSTYTQHYAIIAIALEDTEYHLGDRDD